MNEGAAWGDGTRLSVSYSAAPIDVLVYELPSLYVCGII